MTRLRPTAVLLVQAAVLSSVLAQDINPSLLLPKEGAIRRVGGPQSDALARARGGIVHVEVEIDDRNTFRIERPGTGIVLTPDGLVVTLDSLVREAVDAKDKRIVVVLPDGAKTRLAATLLARDPATDLALLAVTSTAKTPLVAVELGADAEPGDPAMVAAFPDGEDALAFTGAVSEAAGPIAADAAESTPAFARDAVLLTDAAIQRRCHGAALLDATGRLIGICNAAHARESVSEPTLDDLKRSSFGFVIPTATVRRVFAKQLAAVPVSAAFERSVGAAAVARIADAVVGVFGGKGARPALAGDDPYAKRRRDGVGSGVVVDPSGLVLTDRHLVVAAEEIHVTLRNGRSYAAELVAQDASTNSALLRVALPAGTELVAARVSSSAKVAVGDALFAIGNPEGNALLVGDGVVSARRGESIQFDAPAGNQNAGGALVNRRGELIGIVDGGAVDKIDLAYAQRGDQAKVETSLNLAPGIDRLLQVYGEKLAGVARSDGSELSRSHLAEVVDRVGIAMLNVYVEITTKAADEEDNPFAASKPHTMVEGLGSGVVIDGSGLAITNWHVVDSATDPDGSTRPDRVVRVARRDGTVFPAQVLSISREEDLALLQLALEPGQSIPAVELGSSSILEVGDATVAIGNPFGRANTVTSGVVSAKNQSIRVKGRWAKLPHLLETDAAINAGNSGGALLDYDGRLIGINSAGGSFYSVTGFAIAVDHVREKVHSLLLSPEKLRSPWLGTSVIDAEGGLFVQSVIDGGPAALAGVQRGDRVVSFAGSDPRWSVAVAMRLLRSAPGTPIRLELERDGKRVVAAAAPWSAGQWAVCRQTGLFAETVDYRTDPQLVQRVSVAFYRAFVGDPDAAPSQIPEHLVRVKAAMPSLGVVNEAVVPGDFLLGLQVDVDHSTADAGRLIRFESIEDVQHAIDGNSTYEGRELSVWIAHGEDLRRIELTAKRLFL
ncbi:MAG: trypsin-like peptidase domain-containing protein [Planctomycetota bacterium]